ncbi:hypothetical protein PO124_23970 [Bacillus licheniformis]|nr:hypothetical protein [Bacillus licheniformis]
MIVNRGTIRIIDFGLACRLTERERVDNRHPEKADACSFSQK